MLSLSIGVSAIVLGAVSATGRTGESRAAKVGLAVLVLLAFAARLSGRVAG